MSTSVLIGVAWLGMLLAPVLMLADRMVLLLDVRHGLGLDGMQAVLVSAAIGLLTNVLLIFVVCIFTLRWLGWGRGVIDE